MTLELRPEQGAFFDLSARTKLRVSGSDRLRFLNGQVSNDVRKATPETAVHACVLNAKGRINADVFVVSDGESFLIDADAELREALPARLERYIIADDVELTDVSDEFALFHIIGSSVAPSVEGGRAVRADRFGCGGLDLWLSASSREMAVQQLRENLPFCDDACAEVFRIERGVPRWEHELTEEIIATEANLESSAIDYAKGCYIGQEVISRIKMSGQTNKRLCGLTADQPLEAGMKIFSADDKEAGWITSATMSRRLNKQIALGFVKRGFNDVGTSLQAHSGDGESLGANVALEVVALPFIPN